MKKSKEFLTILLIYLFVLQPFLASILSASYGNINFRLKASAAEVKFNMKNVVEESFPFKPLQRKNFPSYLADLRQILKSKNFKDEIIPFKLYRGFTSIRHNHDSKIESVIGQENKISVALKNDIRNACKNAGYSLLRTEGRLMKR